MYSEAAISAINNRIGFGGSFSEDFSIDIENRQGTSGRSFVYFHRLITLKNLYETVAEVSMSSEDFNAYLLQLKEDVVKAVLNDIMQKNELYRNDFDYSDTIILRPELFDDPIGYSMAITGIEQMISSSRTNKEERNASLSYQKLKIEIEGARDDRGNQVAVGLIKKYKSSTLKTSLILFPKPIEIFGDKIW